jgi:hypothetical protein
MAVGPGIVASHGLRYSRSAPKGDPLGGRERDPSFREPLGCEVVAPGWKQPCGRLTLKGPLTRSKRGEPAEGSLNLIVPTPVTCCTPCTDPPRRAGQRGAGLCLPFSGKGGPPLASLILSVVRIKAVSVSRVGARVGRSLRWAFAFFPFCGGEKNRPAVSFHSKLNQP